MLETKQIIKQVLAIIAFVLFSANFSWGESVCFPVNSEGDHNPFLKKIDPATGLEKKFDRETPKNLCALYCPDVSGIPAYCELTKEKLQEQTIYDNCVIAKGSNLMNNQAFDSIKKSCERISKKPSFLQKLRWGS